MKNKYAVILGVFSSPETTTRPLYQGWLLCLLFIAQSIISVGQSGTTVAGGHGPGANPDQLNNPGSIYVTANGVVYVADYDNNRIQMWAVGATSGVTVAGGNGPGSNANQLDHPFGVFVDGNGAIYVADTKNYRIQKFPANSTSATPGVTVAGGNNAGADDTHLNLPTGIYVTANGTLYVTDFLNDRVQKFPATSTSSTPGVTVAGGHGEGSNANQLRHPEGAVVDEATGAVYVADTYNHRVQRWDPGATQGVTVAGGNGAGSDATHLNIVFGLYRDNSNGDLYVADGSNHRIQKFPGNSTSSTPGVTVAGVNSVGADATHLATPEGVFLDDNKRIYVADHANHRIQRFGSCASPIATLVSSGTITCAITSASLLAGGGSAGTIYTFSSGAAQLGGATGNTATVSQGGTYSVTATNTVNGCTSTTTTQVASNTSAPNTSLMNNGPISDNNQIVTLTAGGGGTYQFSQGASQQGGPTGNTATVTTPGIYQVTVTRADNGCTATASTTVTGATNQTVCRNGTAVLTVVALGSPTKYEWYRGSTSTARLNNQPGFQMGTTTTSLMLINQQTTYAYYVRVTDASGSAVVYGPIKVTVNTSCNANARIGVDEVALHITLLGNPIVGEQLRATISGAAGQALTVELVDLRGKPIRSQSWQEAESDQLVEWNLAGQPSGVYVLQATTPGTRQSVKLIKP